MTCRRYGIVVMPGGGFALPGLRAGAVCRPGKRSATGQGGTASAPEWSRYRVAASPYPAYGLVLFVGPVSAAPPGKVARRLRLNGRVAVWRLRLTRPTVWYCL
ncbi:hypothetical protein [Superficieibacter sp. 1612_C1]|uniref:hypothetical protein n=1 Tax=Superficieibacter sp. 1612_C1 TaxID=2780382 RepID=UPI0018848BD9|nr:hypothetical protein [Superficieibacter sp. 1612_C1]